ncbi:hypothetical protein ABZ876_36035 [Streptomyces sp. NPDC046931]|uniref:hypothetical protein n=1 Tax=Streptomyces sp. NPDC046931 TaxID=3154806 RepID=UPI0033DF23BC
MDRVTNFEADDVIAAAEPVRHGLDVCVRPPSIASHFPDLDRYRYERHAPAWQVMVVRPPGEPPAAAAALPRHIR